MDTEIGFDLIFSREHLKAALFVALLSVCMVVGLLTYINRFAKRSYFSVWIVAWVFYALWLCMGFISPMGTDSLLVFVLRQCFLGASAVFLMWGSGRFLKLKVRQEMGALFFVFLFVWSCVGAFHIHDNPLEFQIPVFLITGLTSLLVAWCYVHPRYRRGYRGEGLLAVGFSLWGWFLVGFPFFQANDMLATPYILSAVLHLFIAMSMMVLLLEESHEFKKQVVALEDTHRSETSFFQKKVKATEERYRALFDQASEGIFVVSEEGRILELNAKALGMLSNESRKVIGTDLQSFLNLDETKVDGDSEGGRIEALLQADDLVITSWEGRSTSVDLDGSRMLWDNQKPAFQIFIREQTNKAQLEQQLRQAEKLSALGQMISGIAHELNNPLAAIKGYLELFQSDQNIPEKTRGDLKKVMKESNRAAKLVSNFLSFARERPAQKEVSDLNALVRRVVEMREFECRIAGVVVDVDLADDIKATLIDIDQIQQVLVNLVNNAIQAMLDTEGPNILKIRTFSSKGKSVVSICDNGPGIPPDLQNKVYEPFFTTKEVGAGTGLGLSIAHSIMRDHGGKIEYRESEDGGACFVLEFEGSETSPVVLKGDSDEELKPIDKGTKKAPVQVGNILVVDDEESIADLLCEMLSILGHEATACHSGKHALSKIEKVDYDVVLSDFRMPGMNGAEFYQKAIEINPSLGDRFVFLTGDVVNSETQEFIGSINTKCVDKPFQLDAVKVAVNSVLSASDSVMGVS